MTCGSEQPSPLSTFSARSFIANAFCTLLYRAKILGEPAGVVATAAFLAGKVDTSLTTVATVTGGNLTTETMRQLIEMAETA